jgi:putative cardiolipin synthase
MSAELDAKFAAVHADPQAAAYIQTLRETTLLQQIAAGQLPLEWADARVVRDDPSKTLDPAPEKNALLLAQVLPLMGPPQSSLDLVSPYFVPGEGGTAALADLAQRGNKVRVLTNSLAATDVPPVHAGYIKRRCDLLRAGVKLYELKPSAAAAQERAERVGTSSGSGSGSSSGSGTGSSSAVQLHAKTSAVDRKRVFVGSFNFDERSAFLNTEMGLVIESPVLAQRLSAAFDTDIPLKAYEVRIAADGRCPEWIERTPAGEVRYDVEPQTGGGQRAWIQFLTILPIDWML